MKMIVHEANGLQISQRRENGYINATQMCQASNRKWHEYWRLPSTQEYLTALAKDLGIDVILNKPKRENPSSALVLTFKGGNSQQGTWVHPEVAVDLAAWISVEFRILVNRWVREWITTGQNPIPPQPTPTNADISSLVEELENLIISIRSHGRTIHTGSHQPVDPTLFKSLHTLSHNQLSVINATIQQLELLKRIAEMNTSYGSASPEQTINYLFGSPTSTQDKKPQATETRVVETNPEITESSKSAADDTETDKTKQLTNINVKIPSSQRQWLADTARQVRRNNTKPVAPSDRVYPQHLVSIAIALLQKSNIDIEAAHSIRMEQDEATANINIKINHQQQEWLTATAKTIRNSNQHPTCPHERIYPQHLIAIAHLEAAGVDWGEVRNVEELRELLNL